MFDGKAFGEAIVAKVRSFVDGAIGPVLERLKAIEDRPPPADGKDADPAEIERMVQAAVDKAIGAIPKAADGKDGQAWEDMSVVQTGPRTVELSFDGGERRNTFELEFPVPIYQGVFAAEREYAPGDMVTWGGSLWHFNKAEASDQVVLPCKPGEGSKAWTLAAKRGRDGKDGDQRPATK